MNAEIQGDLFPPPPQWHEVPGAKRRANCWASQFENCADHIAALDGGPANASCYWCSVPYIPPENNQ